MKSKNTPNIALAGHPFAPSGRGEDLRCSYRAFSKVGVAVSIRDIYGLCERNDTDLEQEIGKLVSPLLATGVNIFHINGDEVEQSLAHVKRDLPTSAYNIVYPAWELSRYPAEWAAQLNRFNEIWAPSKFIYDALEKAVSKPLYHLPLASEVRLSSFMGRTSFAIPNAAYCFLFFFDFTSYIARKNPYAVITAFERLCAKLPSVPTCLVIKLNQSASRQEDYQCFRSGLDQSLYKDRIIVIDKTLTNNEIRNLIRCSDCFISLHRAEGFGRGLAEAMYLGKPVIATKYSGNLDFMGKDNACLVDYHLIPVEEQQYPFAQDQVWAEPDIDQAVAYMEQLATNEDYGRRLGELASAYVRQTVSYRACGLRYKARIRAILE